MISNYAPVTAISYAVMPRISTGGRACFPVPANQVLYSQFKYVAGVPSDKGQNGVSIDKLKILNTLIEQLVRMKEENSQPIVTKSTAGKDLDNLIEYVNTKINAEIDVAKDTVYAPLPPQPAVLMSLTA